MSHISVTFPAIPVHIKRGDIRHCICVATDAVGLDDLLCYRVSTDGNWRDSSAEIIYIVESGCKFHIVIGKYIPMREVAINAFGYIFMWGVIPV
jgi:hypothetical protein